MYRDIPLAEHPRKAYILLYRNMLSPYVSVTVPVDLTAPYRWCRETGRSFYLAMIHAAALAADGVPAFRQRLCGDFVREYDACPTSHVELGEKGDFGYCTLRHHLPEEEYFDRAENARRQARENISITEDSDADSMYFVTCLPWLSYTQFTLPFDGKSNPRLSWGKCAEDASGRVTLPFSVMVHHGLADGVHIASFYQRLEEETARFSG